MIVGEYITALCKVVICCYSLPQIDEIWMTIVNELKENYAFGICRHYPKHGKYLKNDSCCSGGTQYNYPSEVYNCSW